MHIRHAHTQALSALARISLTVGTVGCIENTVAPEDGGTDAHADSFIDAALDLALPPITPDSAIFEDAFGSDGTPFDASVPDGTQPLADAGIDMQVMPCPRDAFDDFEAFWACCEAAGFPPGACSPWGPPMPPALVLA